MQINALSNVLMSTPGLGGSTPQNSLLGALLATPQAGTIGNQFAGLLGPQGKQSDLALLNVNNPTGGIEASPQALDIAPLGDNLGGDVTNTFPGLATYIDQPSQPVLKNQVSMIAAAGGNTIDSKKANVGEQILANLKKAPISKDSTAIASDVANKDAVNEQEFQAALKNLDAQKPAEGKIKLADMPEGATATAPDADMMTKIAAHLNEQNNKQNTEAAKTKAQKVEATAQADTSAETTSLVAQKSADLAEKLKPETTKATKTAKDTAKLAIESIDGNPAAIARNQDIHHVKDIKLEAKVAAYEGPTAAHQVEVKIAQMVKDGVDMVRIKLNPSELGQIDIQMDVDNNGQTAIKIIADKSETLDMLRKDSSSLERALRETGVKADAGSMQFSLRDQNQQQQNFAAYQHAQKHSYSNAQVNDNYLKAANVNEYTLSMSPQTDGVNILA